MIESSLTALPETVRGLPLHPLLVHSVVVLVPLVALGALLCVVRPNARRHFGGLVVLGALVVTALVPFVTESGEAFSQRLGAEELVRDHASWGDRMLPVMIVLLVALIGLVGADMLRPNSNGGASNSGASNGRASTGGTLARLAPAGWQGPGAARPLRLATVAFAVLTVVAAVLAVYVVFQTGESGARAVWGGR